MALTAHCPADLIQGSDGDFYGVTYASPFERDDLQDRCGRNLDNALSVSSLSDFSSVLIQGTDGSFYGSTDSSIFRFDPAGTLTSLHTFTGFDGIAVEALIQASDGSLYGTKVSGGYRPSEASAERSSSSIWRERSRYSIISAATRAPPPPSHM